jgi:hypothetical protein
VTATREPCFRRLVSRTANDPLGRGPARQFYESVAGGHGLGKNNAEIASFTTLGMTSLRRLTFETMVPMDEHAGLTRGRSIFGLTRPRLAIRPLGSADLIRRT